MSVIPPGPIDHVGIAVVDLDAAIERYRELLGARLQGREEVVRQGVEVCFLQPPGGTRIELVSPLTAGDEESPIGRFLSRRGEGLHHFCVLVDDIDAALAALVAADVPLVDERARSGAEGARIAFLRPQALGGVLLELKEKAPKR